MRLFIKRCVAAMCILLNACAMHYVEPEDPGALIPDRSVQITPGQMDRAGVRHTLGTPVISSAYWRFDLFRMTIEPSEVPLAVTPWPLPFAPWKDQVQRYTLVAHDRDPLFTCSSSTGLEPGKSEAARSHVRGDRRILSPHATESLHRTAPRPLACDHQGRPAPG